VAVGDCTFISAVDFGPAAGDLLGDHHTISWNVNRVLASLNEDVGARRYTTV
jgi:hypothetical protein